MAKPMVTETRMVFYVPRELAARFDEMLDTTATPRSAWLRRNLAAALEARATDKEPADREVAPA